MKTLTYLGPRNMELQDAPEPEPAAGEVRVRITATAICGSDLHIYRGKIPMMETGDILGHEFMGIVEDTGSAVVNVKRGDRVVIPFTIACGDC
jgi:threonine dehydrogenase-like Zn-dependent dehydrogenase